MKKSLASVLVFVLCSFQVTAADNSFPGTVKDHPLGRVFLSAAERRQLDIIRRSAPRSGVVESTRAAPPAEAVETGRKIVPAGFIVSSHGAPYQWIDGDFRHVSEIELDKINASSAVRITRHDITAGDDDRPSSVKAEQANNGPEQQTDPETDNAQPQRQ